MVRVEYNGDGSGDWIRVIMQVDGSKEQVIFEGHNISAGTLVDILRGCKIDVQPDLNKSDEEML